MLKDQKNIKKIEVRCTEELRDKIQTRIEQLDIKLSDYIRMLIQQDLKEMEGKNE